MAADAECVIVGGGIGGAVLALALGQAGRRVLILEREAAPPAMATARPEILAGATLETFNRLGIGARIVREAALPIAALELFEAGGRNSLFRVTQEDLRQAGARPYSTDPAATRRIVLEEAQRTALVFILAPAAWERFRQAPEEFAAAAAALSPLCADGGRLPAFPEGYGHFRRPFGHAPRYVGDGIALLGDAAHPVTPAGGQGANMSVADAAVLAEVALEALRSGDRSARRLARYEIVRRPANARSLLFSARPRAMFRLLQIVPALAPCLIGFLRDVNRRPDLKRRFLGGVARAFVSTPPTGLAATPSP